MDTTNAAVAALRTTHDHLAEVVAGLDRSAVVGPSFCDEWSIAQTLSHVGSGAEISAGRIDAVVAGEPLPGRDKIEPIWDVWNGRSPEEQASEAVPADERYVQRAEQLTAEELTIPVTMFGMEIDVARMVRMRLAEQALHTWDVEVTRNPGAKVVPDAVAALVDQLPVTARRSGKPEGQTGRVAITTTDPDVEWLLEVGEAVELRRLDGESAGEVEGQLTMPTEALVRLVYGRLPGDAASVGVQDDGGTLDRVRAWFPGT